MDSIGDAVFRDYLAARPDIVRRLDLQDKFAGMTENAENDELDESEVKESRRIATIVMSRLGWLPCDMQEVILEEVTAEYIARELELDQLNENPNRPAMIKGIPTLRHREVFDGTDQVDDDDAFNMPVYLDRYVVEVDGKGIDGQKLDEIVEGKAETSDARYKEQQGDLIAGEAPGRLNQMLEGMSGQFDSVEAAIAAGNNQIALSAKRYEEMEFLCRNIVPGTLVKLTDYLGNPAEVVITDVSYPRKEAGILSGASYSVRYLAPGDTAVSITSFDRLLKDKEFRAEEGADAKFHLWAGLNDADDVAVDAILNDFDRGSQFKKLEEHEFWTGNLWRAMELSKEYGNCATMTNFVNPDTGMIEKAMRIKKKDRFNARRLPVQLRTAEMAFDALRENQGLEIYPDQERKKRTMRVKRMNGGYEVTLPHHNNKDFACIYENEDNLELYEAARQGRDNKRQVTIVIQDNERMLQFIRDVMETSKVKFWAPGSYRQWMTDWCARAKLAGQDPNAGEEIDNDADPQLAQAS
jgi:hypothetical protein